MKRIIYILFAILIAINSMTSCSDYFDINESPDNITVATPDLILPVLVFYAAQTNYDHTEYNIYLAQALTTASRAQVNATAYKGGWEFLSMNRHPQWRRH